MCDKHDKSKETKKTIKTKENNWIVGVFAELKEFVIDEAKGDEDQENEEPSEEPAEEN